MSQHDFNIANQTASNARADINDALQALATLSSGTAAPSTTYANMLWYETDTNTLKMRNEANNAWITVGTMDQSGLKFLPPALDVSNLSSGAVVTSSESMTSNDNDTSLPTTASVIDYVAANSLGVGQTWQTPSRSISTTYQNTTGKPIMVNISIKGNNYSGESTYYLNVGASSPSLTVARGYTNSYNDYVDSLSAVIPPNHYYSFTKSSGNTSYSVYWTELR